MFITGGSRGIGLAIALRAARDGANVALLAKTAEPHPKLPGTVYTAAEEIEQAGGTALPIVGDVRDADSVASAVEQAAERFGGIDILVNNASAISLTPIEQTEPKRYDLMQSINVRGTFLAMRACIPHLKRSDNGHILTLSPPINLDPAWLGPHAAYTLSKYGMTLLTLCAAEELREAGVAANTLWPRTIIATAAVQNLLGGDEAMSRARTPADLRRLGLRDPHQAGARVHRPGADRRRGARRRRRHRSRALPRRGGRRRADRRPVRGPRPAALTSARYRRADGMSIRRGSWTGSETSLRRGSSSPCSPPAGRRAWRGAAAAGRARRLGPDRGRAAAVRRWQHASTTWSSRPPTT